MALTCSGVGFFIGFSIFILSMIVHILRRIILGEDKGIGILDSLFRLESFVEDKKFTDKDKRNLEISNYLKIVGFFGIIFSIASIYVCQ